MHTLSQTDSYTLLIEIKPIAALPGVFNVAFKSRVSGTKSPNELRKVFDTNLDADGLTQLSLAANVAILQSIKDEQ